VRGEQDPQVTKLAFIGLETRIPQDHPLRTITRFADEALACLSPTFDEMYARDGRTSIPPERLLKASLLISLYSVRSERAFCEQLDYNELFRWFLGMNLIEPSFDPSTFSKNRQQLLDHNVAQQFLDYIVVAARRLDPLSDEHFTMDGTLIEATASLKSFRPKDQPPSDESPDDPGNGSCVSATSPRTWRRTTAGDGAPSIVERHAMRGMVLAKPSASEWRRSSAG
jgi:transposase